ncbi:MAG: ABC transporter permease [Thermaerobacter sp.]|nr:ABC transporter permease [Thermaerobacter sp.]
MGKYILARAVRAILTFFLVTVITFVLLHSTPGDIGWILLGRHATLARAAALDRQLGLDLPLPVQYVRWLNMLIQGGGLGHNLSAAAVPTLEYLAFGGGFSLLVAVFLATLQARFPATKFDRFSSGAVYFASTLPSFWIGLVLIYVFAMQLLWLPGNGPYAAPAAEGPLHWLFYMVLPTIALVVPTVASWSGLFRAGVEEALRADYVRTARAQGYSELVVLFRYVLRNALLPIITVAGMSLPTLFNNIVVLEMIFHMNGLGSFLVGSLFSFNYNEAVDLILIISMITVGGNLLADVLYSVADPRVRYS